MTNMENQINATHWVIACGSDCDGYIRADVSQFASENEARNYAERLNEWSDGVQYNITNNLNILRNYCEYHGMDWTDYTHITN
jgi:hypothetical protein